MHSFDSKIADTLKRKNSPQVTLRRQLFRAVLLASIILLLVIVWDYTDNTVFNGSTSPVIDRVEFVRAYDEDRKLTVHMTIHFHDLEGDISHLRFGYFEAGKNFGVLGNKDVNASPGQQRRGATMSSWFTCTGDPVNVDIVAVDAMGNQSASFHERVRCFSSQPLPARWISEG